MRICLLLAALLCAFALLAAPAGADTTVVTAGSDVTVTASDPVSHDVTIGPGAIDGTVRVADRGDALGSADPSCVEVEAGSLDCPVARRITVTLGDEADHLTADASPVAVTVEAGDGDDALALANGLVDDVRCGPGADDASGVDAGDTLTDCEETPGTAGPPETWIDDSPDEDSGDATAHFSFHASEDATFECKLDDAGFAGCGATASFPGLADGSHTLQVRAVDRVRKADATPASYTWAVDTQAPDIAFSSAPAATNGTADFGFRTTDPTATVDCALDGARGACDSVTAMHYERLSEGEHTIVVRAADAAGNTGSAAHTWTVDLTPPATSFAAAPATLTNDATPAFAVAVSEHSTLECALDGAGFTPCSATPSFSHLADGAHSLLVRSTDSVGNRTVTGPYVWTQDTYRPETQLTSGPATSAPVNSPRASFTFASTGGGVRFECSLDSGAWQACASPLTYENLASGTHTFAVRAVDAAGNPDGTPATRTWTVRIAGAPTARIAVARDGDGFALSAAGSRDPEGGALIYRWLRNGAPAGATATVHYDAPEQATRDVFTLTVIDPDGQRGQATAVMSTRETTETTEHEAVEVVRFAGGTHLAAGARARIAALRAAIGAGRASVRVEGYSRPAGDAARISKARAQAVRRLLVKGISPAPAVTVSGRGAAAAVASNATSAGRARNDRVVVTVRFSGPAPRLLTEQEGNPAVSRTTAPQPLAAASGRAPKLFAFYSAVPGAMRRLQEVGSRVDVLAPNWYTLSPSNGAIHGGRPNAKVMALSKTLGFDVWPVVNATMRGSGLIDSAAGRAKVVDRVTKLAAKHHLDGVTLDMEEMLPRQKAAYSTLVAQLASALHAKHRKLAVYAVRRTAADVDAGAAAYDWTALARNADLVLASGYNEHAATTDAGPVTTQAGFAALASYAAATSRTKVAPTIGAFGYRWTGGSARMLSSADAERRWPVAAEVGSADGRAETAGATRTFFESAEDLWARENAVRRAGSRWIGLFTLGREPERFWERSAIR